VPFEFTNNTYRKRLKEDVLDSIDVEIGDINSASFKPHLKLKRWDGEVGFSVEFPSALSGASRTVDDANDTIAWKRGDYTLIWYPHRDLVKHPEGAFEFEIHLGKKPPTNKFVLNFESQGLEAFYQPPLDEEPLPPGGVFATETDVYDIDGNTIAHRPLEIVGSYAIYYKDPPHNVVGGKKYRTGKAFHIERPQLTDFNGDTSWATMNLDGQAKTLTITADATWLANAVYPVIVDPTFGYTSVGASNLRPSNNMAYLLKATSSEDGTVTKLTTYLSKASANGVIRTGIYGWNGTTATHITHSSTVLTITSTTPTWYDYPQTTSVTAGTAILLCVVGTESANIYYDTGFASGSRYAQTNVYNWPATITNFDVGTSKFSMYATYDAASSGTDATVTAVTATSSAEGIAPTVSGTQNPTVTAVVATASASMPVPTVTGGSVVDATVTAVVATATASGIAATITAGATVTGVVGSATAVGVAPTLSANATLIGVVGTSDANGIAPSISGGAIVVGVTGTASASSPAPILSAGATVTGVTGTSSASAPAPSLSAGVTITAVVGTATASAPVPLVSAGINAVVTAVVGTATAAGIAPSLSLGVTITGVAGPATTAGIAPVLSGSATVTATPGRSSASSPVPAVSGSVILIGAYAATFAGITGSSEGTVSNGIGATVRAVVGTATAAGIAPVVTATIVIIYGRIKSSLFAPQVLSSVNLSGKCVSNVYTPRIEGSEEI
jgi:hypothetical protein